MVISSVDLPEPEAPTMPTDSPLAIVRLTLRRIWTRAAPLPRLRSRARKATAGGVKMGRFRRAGSPTYGDWTRRVQIALVVALMSLFSAPAPTAARTLKIVALGDSLTAGLGLPPGKAFPDRLQAALTAKGWDVEVINAGVSGDTAEDGLARFDWAVASDTDALLVELGANDMLRGLPPEKTKAALTGILDRARERREPALLAGMRAAPNLGPDYQQRFDAIYPDLAKADDVPLYPFFLQGVAGDPKLNQKDGMHPTAAGVDVIVAGILPAVEELLKRARP